MWRVFLATVGVLALAPAAGAVERIVVVRDDGGSTTHWTMGTNGRDQRSVRALDTNPTRAEATEELNEAVAPDGRHRASFGNFRGASELTIWTGDLTGHRLSAVGSDVFPATAYAPDGAHVASFVGGSALLISVADGAGTNLGPIPAALPGAGPVWSANGAKFASASAAQIVVVPANGSTRTTVAWAGGAIRSLAFSHAGDALFAGADNLYRVALPGGVRTMLATGPASGLEVSPDGTKIAYVRSGRLVVVDADGSHPVVIGGGHAAWSPDSKRLAFGRAGEVRVVRADGTGDHRIATRRSRFASVTSWLANAIAPAPDRSAPRVDADLIQADDTLTGGFRDGFRSTDVASARIMIRRRDSKGRCHGLTTRGFRLMTCRRAETLFVPLRLVHGPNGTAWSLDRHLAKGRYRIRFRVRDLAGNNDRHPKVLILQV